MWRPILRLTPPNILSATGTRKRPQLDQLAPKHEARSVNWCFEPLQQGKLRCAPLQKELTLSAVERQEPVTSRKASCSKSCGVYHPRLTDGPCPWLFPGKGNKAKSRELFGDQVSKHVFKATGLHVNLHLFRHIAAKLYLDHNPGGYEVCH